MLSDDEEIIQDVLTSLATMRVIFDKLELKVLMLVAELRVKNSMVVQSKVQDGQVAVPQVIVAVEESEEALRSWQA